MPMQKNRPYHNTSIPSAPPVPLEDMSDPKKQLELREVIIVSSRDSSLTIRTTTNILLMHSQQLLNAARDVDAPLPLDCSAATMGILEKLFWAEPWESPVRALTNEVCSALIILAIVVSLRAPLIAASSLQELLDLFEVAHAWRIDAIGCRMPSWILRRDWKGYQQLQELYERAELPDGVHQAALRKLLATGSIAQLTCLRAGDIGCIIDRCQHSCEAVKYLCIAKLPLISPDIAMDVLARLDELAAEHAICESKGSQLQLVDALLHMRTFTTPLSKAVMYFAVKLDPEAGGVESANLGVCIEDMLFHHVREVIRDVIA